MSAAGPVRRDDALPLEIAFLRDWVSDRACLDLAEGIARRQGSCAARVLIAEGFVSEHLFYRALARHLGVPYVEDWPIVDASVVLSQSVALGRAKLQDDAAMSWLFAPEGETLRRLLKAREQLCSLREIGITAPSHFRAVLQLRCELAVAYCASEALPEAGPTLSAKPLRGWGPRLTCSAVAAAIAGLAYATPHVTAVGFGLLFFASIVLRLVVCAAGLDQRPVRQRPLADAELPTYSVLVPLRDETDIVEGLVVALRRLDYPRAKLEVFVLVEPEDRATRDTLATIRLPPWCHVLVGPADAGTLRTKPRALNIGLLFARGTLVTVYDAEDRPDPDQLRRAAERFAASTDRLGCVQARLTIANGHGSLLARLFAIEYAVLFDLFNIGTEAFGLPLALGGTSNHFRRATLRTVGGWDAWNVTEDADLGFRLARFGYKVATIGSTTGEDAPERLGAWMRQRRRWTKGWMQTALVLSWSARDVWRQYGPVKSLFVTLMLANLVIGPPLTPLFAVWMAYRFTMDHLVGTGSVSSLAESTLAVSVISLGIGSTLWTGYTSLRIRGLAAFITSVPLLLPYQLMISVAAWLGFIDLLRHPFHWHKTQHGRAARR